MRKPGTPLRMIGLACAAATVAVLAVSASSHPAAAAHVVSPAVGRIAVTPEISAPQKKPTKKGDLFSCQSAPLNGKQGPRCYSPQQIQKAYDYSRLLARGIDGTGETIVIVDAFSNPYIQQDLSVQDETFGLPAPPSFSIVAPQGVPDFDPNDPAQINWAAEISLDVLAAHAMAPGASIVLVEGASDTDAALYAAEKYAVDNHLGDVMSQSFGEAESCVDPSYFSQWQALFKQAAAQGMTSFASTGDSGAAQFSCDGSSAILAPGWPAADPDVTAVGGTTLNATDPKGDWAGETAWTEPLFGCNPPAVSFPGPDVNCSGGGYSTIFSRPSWQRKAIKGGAGRGVPDVAYDAGVNGGILIHSGIVLQLFYGEDPSTPDFLIFGGTSAGSPQWAALTADADQMAGHDLGGINPALYALDHRPGPDAFHDIVKGNNNVVETGGGYKAGDGWDPVTGLGTPDAMSLLSGLAGN